MLLQMFSKRCSGFINKSVKSSNKLLIEHQHGLLNTFNHFKNITTHIGENVFSKSKKIISKERTGKLKGNIGGENTEKLIEIGNKTDVTISTSPWNQTPTLAKLTEISSLLRVTNYDIPRPQINFKEAVDNSSSLWIPKLSHKPNSTGPLKLILKFKNGKPIGYSHPYEEELKCFHPPEHSLTGYEDLQLPPGLSETPYTYIDNEAGLIDLVKHLNGVKEIAVDVEEHSYRSYQGITCLIQITTKEGGDFIIDALAAREHVYLLNEPFTNPNIIKIFHHAYWDVVRLQRDFSLYLVGLFDTYLAAMILKFRQLSLNYLLHYYSNGEVNKRDVRADWRIRPLSQELINYARTDTHYLVYIYNKMKIELLERSDSNENLLMSVFKNSVSVSLRTYQKRVMTQHSHLEACRHFRKSFNIKQETALKVLFKWRDEQARDLDESIWYILPTEKIMSLAEKLPLELQEVRAMCEPLKPNLKHIVNDIQKIILSCRRLPINPLYLTPCYSTPRRPRRTQQIHDRLQTFEDNGALSITGDRATKILNKGNIYRSDTYMFNDDNVQEKSSSYDEMKSFKEQEAKVDSQETKNRLTKTVVLEKRQQTNSRIENKSCITQIHIETQKKDV